MTWSVAGYWSHAVSGDAPGVVSFNGLAGAHDILLLARNITKSPAAMLGIRVSTDDGASFYSGSGDYQSITDAGVVTAQTRFLLGNQSTTAARGGPFGLLGTNLNGPPKIDLTTQQNTLYQFRGSPLPINAIQLIGLVTTTFTGGEIWCVVRGEPAPHKWELAGMWDHAVSGNTLGPFTFTGLAGAQDIKIVFEDVTKDTLDTIAYRVSTNNGASYHSSSYHQYGDAGSPGTSASFGMHTNPSTVPVSGQSTLLAASLAGIPKAALWTMDQFNGRHFFVNSLDPVNAIWVNSPIGDELFTGGRVKCFVCKVP